MNAIVLCFGNISLCPVTAVDLLFCFVIFLFCFFHPNLCLFLSCSLSAVKRLQRVGQSYTGESKKPLKLFCCLEALL